MIKKCKKTVVQMLVKIQIIGIFRIQIKLQNIKILKSTNKKQKTHCLSTKNNKIIEKKNLNIDCPVFNMFELRLFYAIDAHISKVLKIYFSLILLIFLHVLSLNLI